MIINIKRFIQQFIKSLNFRRREIISSCSWLSYVKRSLLSLRISTCSNVDEFVHQIKEMKRLRQIVFYNMNYNDVIAAKFDEICSRALKLNQHPYLSIFVASKDQWRETFSKEKNRGTFVFEQCQSCRFS